MKLSLTLRLNIYLFIYIFFFFSTRPSLGLLPVLGPLGSGTDTTHQPSPALRLLGYRSQTAMPILGTNICRGLNFQKFENLNQLHTSKFNVRVI